MQRFLEYFFINIILEYFPTENKIAKVGQLMKPVVSGGVAQISKLTADHDFTFLFTVKLLEYFFTQHIGAPIVLLKILNQFIIPKGQLILKQNCKAITSPKKQTWDFYF